MSTPLNGKIIREPAICDDCFNPCRALDGRRGIVDLYYVYNDKNLCRDCAKSFKLV